MSGIVLDIFRVRSYFIKMGDAERIDALGMARATGVDPLKAERVLDSLVGKAWAYPELGVRRAVVKNGDWFGWEVEPIGNGGEIDVSELAVDCLLIAERPQRHR